MFNIIFNRQMWGADACPPANKTHCKLNNLHDELIDVITQNSPFMRDLLQWNHEMYGIIKAYIFQNRYNFTFEVKVVVPMQIVQKFLREKSNWRYNHLINRGYAIQLFTSQKLLRD